MRRRSVRSRFQQGDTLGWSGNSGGSSGPHLHFEVRETATQRPVNPLFWGFEVPDSVAPELSGLWVLPTGGSRVNGSSRPQLISPAAGALRIAGQARFGIEALDRLDGARNRCGIYRAELWINDERLHAWELDTLDFSVNRDMNALAYYEAWERTGNQTYRMHRLPGSRLPVHDAAWSTVSMTSHDTVPVRIELWDVHGNTRSVEWTAAWSAAEEGDAPRQGYAYDRDNTVEQNDARVRIPRNTFYEDFDFPLERMESADRWVAGDRSLPASKSMVVSLSVAVPDSLQQSTLVTRHDRNGDIDGTLTGKWTPQGTFEFTTKACGQFGLAVDTVPPSIRPHRRHHTAQEREVVVQKCGIALADDLAGIQSWEARLDRIGFCFAGILSANAFGMN